MTRAGWACAAAAVALVLALVTACGTLAGPAAPRTPAPVQASWPGCVAVAALPEDGHTDEPSGIGGVPAGFTATKAVLCEQGERTNARGETISVDLERTATDVAALLAYLAQPDEPPTSGACSADGWVAPQLFLLDADGRYVVPAIPVDGCGKPLGWYDRDDGRPIAWKRPTYTDRVVRQGDVVESAEARRTGCSMQYKDVVDAYAASSDRRSGGFGADPFGGRPLTLCVYEVPAEDRGTDTPSGDLVTGRALTAQQRADVVATLATSPEADRTCPEPDARFAVLTPDEGVTVLSIELDGCRRVVSDADSAPVARASDELVALLGG